MSKLKICPLLGIVKATDGGSTIYCLQDGCGMYSTEQHTCGLVTIGDQLGSIEDVLREGKVFIDWMNH